MHARRIGCFESNPYAVPGFAGLFSASVLIQKNRRRWNLERILSLRQLQEICGRCAHRSRPCRGRCSCTIDGEPLVGRDACPKGYFEPGAVGLMEKYMPPRPAAVPFEQWPWWAKREKRKHARPGEKGVGETLKRRFGKI